LGIVVLDQGVPALFDIQLEALVFFHPEILPTMVRSGCPGALKLLLINIKGSIWIKARHTINGRNL
jgi:hypothetical protein